MIARLRRKLNGAFGALLCKELSRKKKNRRGCWKVYKCSRKETGKQKRMFGMTFAQC